MLRIWINERTAFWMLRDTPKARQLCIDASMLQCFLAVQDLLDRSTDPALSHQAKLCMHTGAFVYHFKGSTLPTGEVEAAAPSLLQLPYTSAAPKRPWHSYHLAGMAGEFRC